MPKPRIKFRTGPNSILKADQGGTRLVIDQRKLKPRLQQLAKSTPPKSLSQRLINKRLAAWALVPDASRTLLVEPGTGCQLRDFQGNLIVGPKRAIPSAGRGFRQDLFNHLKVAESFVGHMYLDSKGNATVGYGYLISDLAEAVRLGNLFVFKGTARRPTRKDVENDFLTVKNARSTNASAAFYDRFTRLEMSQADATVLAFDDIDDSLRQAKARFPHFDTFPHPAKLGLLDMVYNLGIGKIFASAQKRGFPRFRAAVRRRDWNVAAKESNRPDVKAARNKQVRDWFLDAAREEPYFVNPNCTKQLQPTIR